MINITIDGKAITVPKGTTVYTAAKQNNIDIPIFCYLDRLPPFGACRMCLVEVEKMGKLQTSCTLEVTEGMVIKTASTSALQGQKEILELLLINHPLDCPICDRGGECPLQDQTLKYGPGLSRFVEEKRHFKKPIALGPVLMLDRERCIACARCTRFGEHIAGDHALEFINRGYKTEVGTPSGGPAESKYIGNTIMICPVGALTSQVYRFRARPWDNDSVATSCTLCPVGCSMALDSRDGQIVRTRSCENREVNDIWLCDKGWFGYDFVSDRERLQTPLIRYDGILQPAGWEEALTLIAKKMEEARSSKRLAGWGGAPLTLEENYFFQKLMRQGGGVSHVDYRIGMPVIPLEEEGLPPGMEISFGESEKLSFILLLGLDVTEEFPILWLRLKQAINKGAKAVFIGHYAPEVASQLEAVHLHAPGQEVATLKALLPSLGSHLNGGALFIGSQYLAHRGRKEIIEEIQKWNKSTASLPINIMEGRGNSMGARLAGMHPEFDGEKVAAEAGLSAVEVIERASVEGWDFLYVAGANPAKKFPAALWNKMRENLDFLVVQDLFLTETAAAADVVLPALSFVEKEGTFVNIEGRQQKLFPGKILPENSRSDEEIFIRIAEKLGLCLTLPPSFYSNLNKPKKRSAEKNSLKEKEVTLGQGWLKATFCYKLFDQGVRMNHNRQLSQMTKEPFALINPQEGAKLNVIDGGVVTLATQNGTEIASKIRFDKKVAPGTIVLSRGFDNGIQELATNLLNGQLLLLTIG